MLDEPYRWLEAISNRRDYIEDQLRSGSPVVGLKYDDGLLLLTIGRGQRKIFEVHDRIALSAMGHTADIERLRLMATDTASVQGFQSSVDDVTLHRLTNFVLGPTIKQAFEAIFGSAYIIRMLLAELGVRNGENQFISLSYDGTVKSDRRVGVIGGTDEAETAMHNYLSAADAADLSLTPALQLVLETWAVGRELSLQEADADHADSDELENGNSESTIYKDRLHEVLQDELKEGEIEAGVLQVSRRSNSKFALLTSEEIHMAITDWL
jgi:proteasome alpha subunit